MFTIDPRLSGVYSTPAEFETLRADALKAGAVWVYADFGADATKTSVLRSLAEGLQFPAGFGANWDALLDCLEDSQRLPRSAYLIRLAGCPTTAFRESAESSMLLEILDEVATYWKERAKMFVVFVDRASDLPQWR